MSNNSNNQHHHSHNRRRSSDNRNHHPYHESEKHHHHRPRDSRVDRYPNTQQPHHNPQQYSKQLTAQQNVNQSNYNLEQQYRHQQQTYYHHETNQPDPNVMDSNFNISFTTPPIMGIQNIQQQQPIPDSFNFTAGMPILPNSSISATALERLQLPQDRITDSGIIPNSPYYELPASLMVPLVPSNRCQYEALNPADIRLPFPKFPDENFLKMIDNYYHNDSARRDNDGWDRTFIDSFLAQKKLMAESSQ